MLIAALMLAPLPYVAQDETISDESWEQAVEGLDYGNIMRPVPEVVEPSEPYVEPDRSHRDWDWDWRIPGLGTFGTALLYGLVIIGLAYLLVFLLNRTGASGRSRVKEGDQHKAYSFEELEEYIHETELDRYLRLALEAGDHKAAVRVYYLMTIKALSEKNCIAWKRDKTNFDYVREMRRHPDYQAFRKLTYTFEVVWYGDTEIDQTIYRKVSPDFEAFLNRLQSHKA